VFVLALEVDLRIPSARSLKDKRQVVKSIVEASRRRFAVSSAEVGEQDSWQRARLGFAVVASSAGTADRVLRDVEDFVWSHPDVEVASVDRHWLE
jgi:uncharacterized protein YlxP (DUF503 family)